MNKAWLLGLCLAAPGWTAAAKKTEVRPMEWQGQFGGPQTGGHRVVETQAEWYKLWDELGHDAPAVDLSHRVAVAVFLGSRNTGGYTVFWRAPKDEGKRVVLRYSIAPPKGMAMQALTLPWAVRLFDKPGKPLVVEGK